MSEVHLYRLEHLLLLCCLPSGVTISFRNVTKSIVYLKSSDAQDRVGGHDILGLRSRLKIAQLITGSVMLLPWREETPLIVTRGKVLGRRI